MYNGIGLTTPRGTGTNGFVQRNMSHLPNKVQRTEYAKEDDLKRLESEAIKGPNKEILLHQRKRQIELKCLEMRELMEEEDYTEEEIEKKVSKFRKMLFEKEAVLEKVVVEHDKWGRPMAKDSHEAAHAQAEKNRKFKQALGLPADYVDGSSLEKLGKSKEDPPAPTHGFIDDIDDDVVPVAPPTLSTIKEEEKFSPNSSSKKKHRKHKERKKEKRQRSRSRSASPKHKRKSTDPKKSSKYRDDRRSRSPDESESGSDHHHSRHHKDSKKHRHRGKDYDD